MKSAVLCAFLYLLVSLAGAQTPTPSPQAVLGGLDGNALAAQLSERQQRIAKLSSEDQIRLRAAQQRALEDPAVQEAIKDRDRAMGDFQAAFIAGLLKSDPEIAAILDKLRSGVEKGY